MKQQCLHVLKLMCFLTHQCASSALALTMSHTTQLSQKEKLFFPPIFLSRTEGALWPRGQIYLRNTHGCRQPGHFLQWAEWSRKTQWHCHTLHTACCVWGTQSHNPWETEMGEKRNKHCLRGKKQPGQLNTNTTTSSSSEEYKKNYSKQNKASPNKGMGWDGCRSRVATLPCCTWVCSTECCQWSHTRAPRFLGPLGVGMELAACKLLGG